MAINYYYDNSGLIGGSSMTCSPNQAQYPGCSCAMCKLIQTKSKNMNSLSTMLKKFLDEDTKTLIKAGYFNNDLSLTSKGKEANDAINFKANLKELVAMAQADLDEEAKTK